MIEPNDDDVICVSGGLYKCWHWIHQIVKPTDWVQGREVELLQTSGGGWQKGKLKVCFQFIPDKPLEQPVDDLNQGIHTVRISNPS